jgi:DNA polymerase III delta prime subunit
MARSRPLDVQGNKGFKVLVLNEVDRCAARPPACPRWGSSGPGSRAQQPARLRCCPSRRLLLAGWACTSPADARPPAPGKTCRARRPPRAARRLSREAQQSLRRTMEKYSGACRLVMCCSNVSKVMEPVRSRCLCVRVPGPRPEELMELLQVGAAARAGWGAGCVGCCAGPPLPALAAAGATPAARCCGGPHPSARCRRTTTVPHATPP